MTDPQTLNRYAYVRNNPLTLVDPNGLDESLNCDDERDCYSVTDPGTSTGIGVIIGANEGDGTTCSYIDYSCGADSTASDPTSGGSSQNSGSDCGADSSTCFTLVLSAGSAQSGTVAVDIDSGNMYMVVTGMATDIQTESADLGDLQINSQLSLDCGGCMLSQIQNNNDAMSMLTSAGTFVNGLGWGGLATPGVVLAAPFGTEILIGSIIGSMLAPSILNPLDESIPPDDHIHKEFDVPDVYGPNPPGISEPQPVETLPNW